MNFILRPVRGVPLDYVGLAAKVESRYEHICRRVDDSYGELIRGYEAKRREAQITTGLCPDWINVAIEDYRRQEADIGGKPVFLELHFSKTNIVYAWIGANSAFFCSLADSPKPFCEVRVFVESLGLGNVGEVGDEPLVPPSPPPNRNEQEGDAERRMPPLESREGER